MKRRSRGRSKAVQESSPPTRRRCEALRRCAPVEELPSQVCVAGAADLLVRARTDLSPRATRDLAATGRNRVMLAQAQLVTAQTDEEYISESGKSIFDQFLRAAVDASFADCDKTYRSTSGFVLWFGGTAIDWECKRQPLVTLSTMESEFVAASKLVCSIRFIRALNT